MQIGKLQDFHPASIVTNFENAMFKVFSEVYSVAKRTGCFLLFSKCIFRKVQSNGLVTDCAASEFSLFIRSLAAVIFLPVDDVIANFDTLIDAGYPDRAEPVVNYFEDNFIGRSDRRGICKQPTFPINSWNVFDRVLESLPRTNNRVDV
jgi:hypothetical protein